MDVDGFEVMSSQCGVGWARCVNGWPQGLVSNLHQSPNVSGLGKHCVVEPTEGCHTLMSNVDINVSSFVVRGYLAFM